MKIITGIFLTIILASCTSERVTIRSFYDFTPYTEEGFFITPNPYLGDHEPIGLVTLEIHPAVINKKSKSSDPYNSNTYQVYEYIPPEQMLEMLVDMAMEEGATGIANFSALGYYDARNGLIRYYLLSGFAFKDISKK